MPASKKEFIFATVTRKDYKALRVNCLCDVKSSIHLTYKRGFDRNYWPKSIFVNQNSFSGLKDPLIFLRH